MNMPAQLRHGQHGKLGYFLALSALAHLLVALLPGRLLANSPLQLAAPELMLATIANRAPTPRAPRPAPLQTETVAVPAAAALSSPSLDSEPRMASDPVLANNLRSLLHTELDRRFVYPDFARRQGWEGQVDVEVHLDGDGRLDAARIVRSSGYRILDEDALLTLQRIGAIPEARIYLHGYSYDLQLPILYRLTKG